LTWDLVRKVRELGNCIIINHYGPTETTIGALTFEVQEDDPDAGFASTVPIGRPIANGEAYILDRRLRPVPIGVAGEIYLGGAGLSQGYINQPEQSSLRFVSHPFSPGKRLYRTGDRGRMLPGGNIEFLGRGDNQVKIRGFRVEMGEIEVVISRHPSVRQAVVVAREARPGELILSAYVVLLEPTSPDTLQEYLREQLPEYMIPAELTFLETIPLLPNGKIDRQALLARVEAPPVRPRTLPRNPVEQRVWEIWSEVLKREDISVNDSFFGLGGHSLLATMVIARIRTSFDVQLPLRTIYQAPTIAGLAELVQQHLVEAQSDADLERALTELEQLSDAEVREMLEESERKGVAGV
jgi:acyl carrier protein